MKTRYAAAIAMGVGLLGAAACSSEGGSEPVSEVELAAGPACPTLEAIYQRPATWGVCPVIPGWSEAPLFANTTTASLTRWCRYTYTGGGTPDFVALSMALKNATGSSVPAEPDCPVVAPLGLADVPEVYGPMVENFERQASRLAPLPSGSARIRVAVIDTAARPFWSSDSDTYGHGRAVGRVIQELACPPGGFCASEIDNWLGLPLVKPYVTNHEQGGYFGTRGQLARAIVDAVDDWAADYAASPKNVPPRLILNLSVGWTPEHGGADGKKMPAPARAVFDALSHASCYGALNIAASGNHSGGTSTGPMLPGGWEIRPAPTDCVGPYGKLKTPYEFGPTPGTYAPLVHAASSVNGLDHPSPTTRPGGLSRLVAYGTSVVTTDWRSAAGRTMILSGTSMAAAIASGAAAAAWSYRPDWTADQVMEHVYAKAVPLVSGEPTGDRKTDFCLGSVSCWSHALKRVSVCDAAVEAFHAAGGSGAPKCQTIEAHAGSPPLLPHDLTPYYPMPTTGGLPCSSPSDCGIGGDTFLLTPWVDPQPIAGCDACVLLLEGMAYIDLVNPGFEAITNVTVVTYDARFNVLSAERIQSPYGTTTFPEVFRASIYVPPGVRSAEIHFKVDDGVRPYEVREPLPLY